MSLVLLDTNVVARLVDTAAAQYSECWQAVEALISRGDQPCLAAQVLIEFWVVATRPLDVNGLGWGIEVTADTIRSLCEQFPLLPDCAAVFTHWLALATGGVRGKRAHDARLVAFMRVHNIAAILTLNLGDFEGLPAAAWQPLDVLVHGVGR